MKPLFISRDGVVNHRVDGGVNHRTQLDYIAGSLDTIAALHKKGFTVIMVTHQPGLSRGTLDLDELEAIHSSISDSVEARSAQIAAIFYCGHDEKDHCYCRPPATGLLDVIEMELDCHAEAAFYFCDNQAEFDAATKKGCQAFLLDGDDSLQQRVATLTL